MKVRLQADADFNHDIVRAVLRRDPNADFQSAVEAGLEGVNDLNVLALAAEQGRILVTHDHKTMREAREYDRERFQSDTIDGQLARLRSNRDIVATRVLH